MIWAVSAVAAGYSGAVPDDWSQLNEFLRNHSSAELADIHVSRREPATEALSYAIGPERVRSLHGLLDNAALSVHELAAALPDIEAAFMFPPDERLQVRGLLYDALVDSATLDSDDVLDTLPRRARWVADRAMGLVSVCLPII